MFKPIKQNKKVRPSSNLGSEEVSNHFNKQSDVVVKPPPRPVNVLADSETAQQEQETSPVQSLLMDLDEQEKAEMYALLKAEFENQAAVAEGEVDLSEEEEV